MLWLTPSTACTRYGACISMKPQGFCLPGLALGARRGSKRETCSKDNSLTKAPSPFEARPGTHKNDRAEYPGKLRMRHVMMRAIGHKNTKRPERLRLDHLPNLRRCNHKANIAPARQGDNPDQLTAPDGPPAPGGSSPAVQFALGAAGLAQSVAGAGEKAGGD